MSSDAVKKEPGGEEGAGPAPRWRLKPSSAWQMILLLALVLVALVGLCQVTGLARKLWPAPTPTATPTALPTFTPLPTLPPTATLAPTATSPPQITPGGQVLVRGAGAQKLRLRASPGLSQETLTALADDTKLKVLEGPRVADGYVWWRVQTDDGKNGWAASNWLVPVVP